MRPVSDERCEPCRDVEHELSDELRADVRRNRERFELECGFLAKEKRVVRLSSRRDIEQFALSPLP